MMANNILETMDDNLPKIIEGLKKLNPSEKQMLIELIDKIIFQEEQNNE